MADTPPGSGPPEPLQTLSSRLQSLLPSFAGPSEQLQEAMRPPRSRVPRIKPKPRLPSLQPAMPSPPPSSQPSPQKSTLPVLRWLGRQPSSSSLHSSSSSRSVASSRSDSPLSSLQDALSSPLPSPPPLAHPSASHQPAHSHPHLHPSSPSIPPSLYSSSPAFLRTLTSTTLPTATLSQAHVPPSIYAHDPFEQSHTRDIYTPALSSPIIVESSPPQRSSLDTLRFLQNRERERERDSQLHTQSIGRKEGKHRQAASYSTSANAAPSSSSWWWFQGDNKENVDRLLDESDRADTIAEEQSNIARKYLAPKNPLVFCHGLLGFDSVMIGPSIAPLEVTHWRGIKEVLEAIGAEVLITRVPATSSPAERAKVLEKKVEEVYAGRKVHLIGHSMGGLDCRYMTTNLHSHTFSVLSVTTIATPHRGSVFADHFLDAVGRTRLPQVLSLLDLLPNGGGDGKAFESLTVENMRKFNEETPNLEGVRYFSWGAVYNPGLIDTWKYPHSVVLEKEGPNDGLVSVQSAKWGTYLGTLESVNHLDLVGWINTARYKWAELRGKEIKFKPATFYLGVADFLAREVEGQGDHAHKDRPEECPEVEAMGRRVAEAGTGAGAAEEVKAVTGSAEDQRNAASGAAGGERRPVEDTGKGGGQTSVAGAAKDQQKTGSSKVNGHASASAAKKAKRKSKIEDDPWDASSDDDDDDEGTPRLP